MTRKQKRDELAERLLLALVTGTDRIRCSDDQRVFVDMAFGLADLYIYRWEEPDDGILGKKATP